MHRNAAKLTTGGRPASWLGVNFWSRTGGPLMWRNYDPDAIRAELGVLRAHGLSMTRSFFYWPDFMPEPYRIDEDMTARFGDFLDRHAEAGLTTVPTFLVGHMSGENWDPAWRAGRDLYADVWMVAREAWFAGEMVRRFAGHEAVCGWLVSNEMPIYGGAAPRETIAAWAQIILSAVRAAGGTQPVSLGDGAWGSRSAGATTGSRSRTARASATSSARTSTRSATTWSASTTPRPGPASWPATYGAPVILEEFGVSSDFVSDASAAHYYRQVLHNSLLAGATGWIAWNNTDYDGLAGQDPYRHHAFEMHFGLTDAQGAAKPQLAEMAAFGETLDRVGFGDCQRSAQRRGPGHPVVPGHRLPVHRRGGPHLPGRGAAPGVRLGPAGRPAPGPHPGERRHRPGRPAVPGALGQAAAQPHLAPAGGAGRGRGGRLRLLLTGRPRRARRPLVRAARTACSGSQHELGYGAPARTEDEPVTFTLAQDFGTLPQGAQLTFAAAGGGPSRSYLPVRPDGAEVLAVDSRDRPALLVRRARARGR